MQIMLRIIINFDAFFPSFTLKILIECFIFVFREIWGKINREQKFFMFRVPVDTEEVILNMISNVILAIAFIHSFGLRKLIC